AAADADEAHLLQRQHGFTDRRPPDAELFHELALGRQLVTGRITAVVDHRLDAGGDLLVELAAPDRVANFRRRHPLPRFCGRPKENTGTLGLILTSQAVCHYDSSTGYDAQA